MKTRIRIFKRDSEKNTPPLCEYVALDLSSFTGVQVIKLSKYPRPLVLTRWIRGNRAVCVRIFDPALGKEALLNSDDLFCSIDLMVEIKSDHLDITTFSYKDRNDATITEESRIEWSPSEAPKVDSEDNP